MLLTHYWLQEEPGADSPTPDSAPTPDLSEQITPQDIIDHNIEWGGKVWEDPGNAGTDSDNG